MSASRLRLVAFAIGRWLRWAGIALCALWLIARLIGVDTRHPAVAFISFTPLVGLFALAVTGLVIALRRWRELIVAGAVVAGFLAVLLPGALPDPDADRGDIPLKVLSFNLGGDRSDPAEILALVRTRKPDVLALQEFRPELADGLLRSGIGKYLPEQVLRPQPWASGTALFSRYPLRNGRGLDKHTTFDMARATMDFEGIAIDVTAVHTSPPISGPGVDRYQRDFAQLPHAADSGPIRVLAGDFNATLDHRALRTLLATGFRDAAETVGDGLSFTWPAHGRANRLVQMPIIAIDHVLADERVGVKEFQVLKTARSDHRAIYAELRLPN